MSASFSKTIVLGHVGQDPKFELLPNKTPVAKFSIATNESYKDAQGVKQESVEWHNIVDYSRLAEIVRDYVRKGSLVLVEGRNKTSSWQDSGSGKTMYRTSIVVATMKMMGKPDGNAQSASAASSSSSGRRTTEQAIAGTEITNDDIPF